MSLIVSIGTSPLKDNSLRKIHDTSSEIFGGINFCIDGEGANSIAAMEPPGKCGWRFYSGSLTADK